MTLLRQIQSCGPTAISVSTENGDFHMAPKTVLSTTALAVHRAFSMLGNQSMASRDMTLNSSV
jgi:hypothetical protein